MGRFVDSTTSSIVKLMLDSVFYFFLQSAFSLFSFSLLFFVLFHISFHFHSHSELWIVKYKIYELRAHNEICSNSIYTNIKYSNDKSKNLLSCFVVVQYALFFLSSHFCVFSITFCCVTQRRALSSKFLSTKVNKNSTHSYFNIVFLFSSFSFHRLYVTSIPFTSMNFLNSYLCSAFLRFHFKISVQRFYNFENGYLSLFVRDKKKMHQNLIHRTYARWA